jgi:hypothetical protein
VGDRVVIKFTSVKTTTTANWGTAKVIGFESHPKGCFWEAWDGPDIDSAHPWTESLLSEGSNAIDSGALVSDCLLRNFSLVFDNANAMAAVVWKRSIEALEPSPKYPAGLTLTIKLSVTHDMPATSGTLGGGSYLTIIGSSGRVNIVFFSDGMAPGSGTNIMAADNGGLQQSFDLSSYFPDSSDISEIQYVSYISYTAPGGIDIPQAEIKAIIDFISFD